MSNQALTESQAMDKQIAERLFGWVYVAYIESEGGMYGACILDMLRCDRRVPRYSTDLGAATPVWAWIRERWAQYQGADDEFVNLVSEIMQEDREDAEAWHENLFGWFYVQADVPMTLCRVALRLLDAEEAAKHVG